MALEEKIVSDSAGNTTANKGTIQPVKDSPYNFYAVTVNADGSTSQKQEFTMVLPVGGDLSGLYRFPRVGEKVLVDGRYLLGYLPSEGTGGIPFAPVGDNLKTTSEKNKLLADQQGMALRYRQTGKQDPKAGEEYSEIGFYHQTTSWKPNKPTDYSDKDTKGYPKTDRLNIQSTGDIHAKAQNHYQTRAKRFELLVDCDEVDHTSDKQPFEDMPGDDSNLYAGDAHIRAKNRIVIKAGDEIVLEVGRSTIRISDSGITLSSKKVKGNFVNPWNTVLSLTPRDGIHMFGQHLNMQGAFDFTLSDAMGGSFSSLGGMVRLLGKDIKAKTLTNIQYLGKQLAILSQFGIAIDAMSSGMQGRYGDVGKGRDTARALFGKVIDTFHPLIIAVANAVCDDDKTKDPDPIQYFLLTLDILIKINAASCGVLAERMRTKKELKHDIRDQINLAQMVVEGGLMALAAFLITAGFGVAWTHSAMLQLRGTAHITQSSLTRKTIGAEEEDAASPLAGYVDKGVNALNGTTKTTVGIIGLVLSGLTGTFAYGPGDARGDYSIGTRWDKTEAIDKNALNELMEL